MEEDSRKSKVLELILRIPGVLMLELLYMDVLTFKDWNYLAKLNQVSSQWNYDILFYIVALLLVLLPRKPLVDLYCCVVSLSSLFLSHYIFQWLLTKHSIVNSYVNFNSILQYQVSFIPPGNTSVDNIKWISVVANEQHAIETCVTVILSQIALILFSCKMINEKPKALLLLSSPLYPWLTCMFTSNVLTQSVVISYYLSCVSVAFYFFKYIDVFSWMVQMKIFWVKIQLIIRIFGWQGVLTWAQDEYQVQRLLVTCWILRYAVQLIANIYLQLSVDKLDQNIFNNLKIDVTFTFASDVDVAVVLIYTAAQCLTTTLNLFGLVFIVKDVVKLQYFLTRSWLHWSFHDHPPDSVSGPLTGVIDGITLLIMALYTDILNIKVESRMIVMIYILFTIASSQFQSMFNIVDPILMTLATAHNGSVWKHIRTVLFALTLLLISGVLSYVSFFAMRSTFWVFIVAYNYVNTFSLILGSLAIYCILMIDYLTLRGWTSLDDVMFYIRGACRAVEFCITLSMCGYIMMTFYSEMSSFAGIVMLAIYTYYCIVQRGGKGWKIWQMRRQASHKVCSLPLASKSELAKRSDDLCPICYQAMESDVRIMHCNHFFHENCLKKWFYIQDKCPMCYAEFRPTVRETNDKSQQDNSSHAGSGEPQDNN